MSDLIKALLIFKKYGDKEYPTDCKHDVLSVDINYDMVSDEDKKELKLLGFIYDDENETFKSYRFGSC